MHHRLTLDWISSHRREQKQKKNALFDFCLPLSVFSVSTNCLFTHGLISFSYSLSRTEGPISPSQTQRTFSTSQFVQTNMVVPGRDGGREKESSGSKKSEEHQRSLMMVTYLAEQRRLCDSPRRQIVEVAAHWEQEPARQARRRFAAPSSRRQEAIE